MFITLEGGEGAGKSTQARRLAERIAGEGRKVICTREPGGAPGAEVLRSLLLGGEVAWSTAAEVYLHFAARAEHLARTILPALAAGTVVVCDRFADSTMAYQGFGLGADKALIAGLTRLLPVLPALTIWLVVPPAMGAERVAARPGRLDRYEALDAAFHGRVAEGYAALAAGEPGRIVAIGGDADVETVAARVWDLVRGRLA